MKKPLLTTDICDICMFNRVWPAIKLPKNGVSYLKNAYCKLDPKTLSKLLSNTLGSIEKRFRNDIVKFVKLAIASRSKEIWQFVFFFAFVYKFINTTYFSIKLQVDTYSYLLFANFLLTWFGISLNFNTWSEPWRALSNIKYCFLTFPACF